MTPPRRRSVLRGALAVAAVAVLGSGLAGCTPPPRCGPARGAPCTVSRTPAQRVAVFAGLGAWVDVYDWSPTIARRPAFGLDDLDALAAAGVRTVYIQSARASRPEAILDQDRFVKIVDRAHSLGLEVVSWYLVGHGDLRADWLRLVLPVWLGVDGIVWDIEDTTTTKDVDERNRRLVAVAEAMRHNYPDLPMGAAVLPPVVTDVLNQAYWPRFPWTSLADSFDVWLPMSYWTNRSPGTEWRDAGRYTAENIRLLRRHLGRPDAPVHPIGGLAAAVTDADLVGFVAAARAAGSVGWSLYDAATSASWTYARLRTG